MQISSLTGIIAGIALLGTTSLSALPQTSISTPATPVAAVGPAAQNLAGPVAVQPTSQSQGGTAALGVFTLSLTGSCPGPVTIAVSGATPGGAVAIAYSLSTGSFTIGGGGCAGTTLGLASPNLLTVLTADAFGTAGFIGNAPAGACGAFVQAVDLASCSPSGVAVVGGPPPSIEFPSATSAIVGSVGFIDAESCGYWWSNVRGDGATETVSGPASSTSMTFDCDVTLNALNGGNVVDMDLVINGVVVDSFTMDEFATSVNRSASYAAIAGPTYVVELRVTNLVPGGGGSVAFRYAGIGDHDLTLL